MLSRYHHAIDTACLPHVVTILKKSHSIRADLIGGDGQPVGKCATGQQPAGLVGQAIDQNADRPFLRRADLQHRQITVLVSPDIGSGPDWPREATLISSRSRCGIAGINCRAARQQRHRQDRTSVVSQRAELRVGVVQAPHISERASAIGAEVMTSLRDGSGAVAGKVGS